ncbi:MAG TPA: large conductance mechanosensitive channel protein MscL [Deltaproteobacteria bacterium]|nr:large conductance mechanosensitive channel protein MscL [Deltaproteobacteria bacterium]HPR54150.1 large conductance mechanosensitive channel protein MscL [Deltaproteobacteria bacterium]HXK48052.1 large conductance mechanosensitive channel protein MscL [Deltaproteobacteria bacterium]
MAFLQEFRSFVIKKNVVDMAVSITIGAALGRIVTSIVTDIIKPLIGTITGEVTFSDFVMVLRKAADGRPAVVLPYGRLVQAVSDFFIIALAVFMVSKAILRFRKSGEQGPA